MLSLIQNDLLIDEMLWRLLRGQSAKGNEDELTQAEIKALGRRSQYHGVSELLYWHWGRQSDPRLPEWLLTNWEKEYWKTLARNTIWLKELSRLVEVLAHQKIDVVLLKGCVFCERLYDDPGLRPMSDLDLLVREENLQLAIDLLRGLGYVAEFTVLNQRNFEKREHAYPLQREVHPRVSVELHWKVVVGDELHFSPNMEWFWKQTETWSNNKEGVYVLNPTATLLFACAHLALQHGIGGARILWFMDIMRMLDIYSDCIDWGELIQKSLEFEWSAAVYTTLKAVQERLEIKLPSDVLTELKAQITPFEEKYVNSKNIPTQNMAMSAWNNIQGLSWSGRIHTAWSHLFPQPKFMAERYSVPSRWLVPFFYPYRWFDMSRKMIDILRLKRAWKNR